MKLGGQLHILLFVASVGLGQLAWGLFRRRAQAKYPHDYQQIAAIWGLASSDAQLLNGLRRLWHLGLVEGQHDPLLRVLLVASVLIFALAALQLIALLAFAVAAVGLDIAGAPRS